MSEQGKNLDNRKIFFIYHPPKIEEIVIKNVISNEYEAYCLSAHYEKFSPLFKEFNNSILFVNTTNMPQKLNWRNYYLHLVSYIGPELVIVSFQINQDKLSVLNDLSNHSVPEKNYKLENGYKSMLPPLFDLLDSYNARGRRRYVRVKCEHSYSASFSIKFKKELFVGSILDISSFGMACTFSTDPELIIKSKIDDIQLRLSGIVLSLEGSVFGIRVEGNEKIYVIIFDYKGHHESKSIIHEFVYTTLQKEMGKKLVSLPVSSAYH